MIPRSITEIKTMAAEENIDCKECIHYSGNTTLILKVEGNKSLIMTYNYKDSNVPRRAEIVSMDPMKVIEALNMQDDKIRGALSNRCDGNSVELTHKKACAIARLNKTDIGPESLSYEEVRRYLVDAKISHLANELSMDGVFLTIKGEMDTMVSMKWDDEADAAPSSIRINTRSYDDYASSIIFSDSSLDGRYYGEKELEFGVMIELITRLRRNTKNDRI